MDTFATFDVVRKPNGTISVYDPTGLETGLLHKVHGRIEDGIAAVYDRGKKIIDPDLLSLLERHSFEDGIRAIAEELARQEREKEQKSNGNTKPTAA